jgi:hypothetical protein
LYCNPKLAIITDVHKPSLVNATFNAQLNGKSIEARASFGNVCSFIEEVEINTVTGGKSTARVTYLNWADQLTYPLEAVDVIIGSDLVYDANILRFLVLAISSILVNGRNYFQLCLFHLHYVLTRRDLFVHCA